jgi:hypothetical protein
MRSVRDNDLNEVFRNALSLDPTLLISEYTHLTQRLFRKDKETVRYQIYHEEPALDGRAYQARVMMCACGSRDDVMTYLYGIINGILNYKEKYGK